MTQGDDSQREEEKSKFKDANLHANYVHIYYRQLDRIGELNEEKIGY